MSANVQTMFSGMNITPWHKEGKVVNGLLTSEEAIKAAELDWSVSKIPTILSNNGSYIESSDYHFIKRNDVSGNDSILGVVGKNYIPLQNKDSFKAFDSIIEAKEAVFETAGALGKGEKIWILAKIPEIIKVGNDVIENYLLLSNSHNGTSSVFAALTNIRVVCQNTLAIALNSTKNMVKVRHSTSILSNLDEGFRVLGLIKQQTKQAEEVYTKMSKTYVDSTMVTYFLEHVIPSMSKNEDSKRVSNIRDTVKDLFEGYAKGSDLPEFKGTAWGLYNSVIEYVDYYKKTKNSRLQNMLYGSGAMMKDKAFDVALTLDKNLV